MKKIRLFRTNQNPKVQYEFDDIELSEDEDKGTKFLGKFLKTNFRIFRYNSKSSKNSSRYKIF